MRAPSDPRRHLHRWPILAGALAAALTLAAPSPVLGQDRSYELVSPADDGLYNVEAPYSGVTVPHGGGGQRVTADGEHAVFTLGSGTLPGMARDGEVIDYAIASRGPTGWSSTSPLGDRSSVGCGFEGGSPGFYELADDGASLIQDFPCPADKARFSGVDPATGEPLDQTSGAGSAALYHVDVASDTAALAAGMFNADGQTVRTGGANDEYLDGAPDLSTIYFKSTAGLLPDVPVESSSNQYLYLYRRTGDDLTLLTRTATGEAFGLRQVNPNPLDRPNAMSADSSTFTLTAPGETNLTLNKAMVNEDLNTVDDVYQVRDGAVQWVSNPAAVPPGNRPALNQTAADRLFQGASADGSKVYFSTREQLTADDTDTALDLYLYDASEPADSRISRVSTSDAGVCAGCDDNASNTTALNDSQAKFVTVSDDGGRMFFISGDVLNEADDDVQPSLYVHAPSTGATTYVAPAGATADSGTTTAGSLVRLVQTPNPSFGSRQIKLSTDGSVAVFSLATNTNLPAGRGGVDADTARDLFVWRDGDGLRRVRQGLGADDNTVTVPTLACPGVGQVRPKCRGLTSDASLAFVGTTDSLVAEDTDGGQDDVYAVDTSDGSVSLVSPPGDAQSASTYVDNSESGRDVFFLTAATLDPTRDGDAGRPDVYNARLGDAFPPLPPPAPRCVGDACQPPGPGAAGAPLVQSGEIFPTDNVASRERVRRSLRVLRPSRRAVRRMARTGRLALRVRLTGGGTIRLGARARVSVRVGGRVRVRSRRVASARRTVTRDSAAPRLVVRLSREANRQLRRNRKLGVRIQIRVSGLGTRTMRVVPRRPASTRDRSGRGANSARDDRKRG